MLQRTSEITFFAHRSLANSLTRDPCKLPYTGLAKLNGANAVSFVVTVKHVLENFLIFSMWNNSSFTHFEKYKIKYFY